MTTGLRYDPAGRIDWAEFFARPGVREMSAAEIAQRVRCRAIIVRKAARRRGIKLPDAPPPALADHKATLAELAALQAVPRYDVAVA